MSRLGECGVTCLTLCRLLRDAVLRAVGAADTIGVRALLVHAISERAKTFYEQWGLTPSAVDPMTLMITIDDAQRTLTRTAD